MGCRQKKKIKFGKSCRFRLRMSPQTENQNKPRRSESKRWECLEDAEEEESGEVFKEQLLCHLPAACHS